MDLILTQKLPFTWSRNDVEIKNQIEIMRVSGSAMRSTRKLFTSSI